MVRVASIIKSDLAYLDRITDNEINYSDAPALDDSFFSRSLVTLPNTEKAGCYFSADNF